MLERIDARLAVIEETQKHMEVTQNAVIRRLEDLEAARKKISKEPFKILSICRRWYVMQISRV